MMLPSLLAQRVMLSLTTIPSSAAACYEVIGITLATTSISGVVAVTTGYINIRRDWDPPSSSTNNNNSNNNIFRPLSAFIFPSLFEELIWRGAFLPSPALVVQKSISSNNLWVTAGVVLAIHVASHPIAALTVWPRGKEIFGDFRFLLLATIVLGGATASYIVSGGSVWAAALTHGLPVALWRDCFGGEKQLSRLVNNGDKK